MSGILHKQTHAPPIECEQRAMRDARRARGGADLPRNTWVMPEDRYAIVSRGTIRTGSLADAIEAKALRTMLAEVTAQIDKAHSSLCSEMQRAHLLADEAGSLRTERDELLRENAVFRRRVEQLETQAKKRR